MSRKLSALMLCVLTITLTLSCGQIIDPDLLARSRFSNDPAAATISNYQNWKHIWKKGSWIVSIEDAKWKAGKNARLSHFNEAVQSALLQGMFKTTSMTHAKISGTKFQHAAEILRQNLEIDLIAMNPTLPLATSFLSKETPLSFLAVQLNNHLEIGQQLLSVFDSPIEIFTKEIEKKLEEKLSGVGSNTERGLVAWQFASLTEIPGAQYVEPNLYSVFNSPYVPAEFEFRSRMVDHLRLIKADLAYSFTGQGTADRRPINVAVLDTGVDSKHPDLETQMWINENETDGDNVDNDGNGAIDDIHGFDATMVDGKDPGIAPKPGSADLGGPGSACPTPENPAKGDTLVGNCGHGTHVAGIIAARHGGDPQTLGVCPNCKIMSVRVAERCLQPETSQNNNECVVPKSPLTELQYEVDGNISDVSQIRALQYLFNTRSKSNPGSLAVNIVNMSLGKYFRSRAMAYLIQNLQKSNVVVVAAAGNDDTDTPSYPAAYESVVAVCATSAQGFRGTYGKAIFSNFGEWVDICAPGTSILSTVPGKTADGSGRTDSKPGTSQATPFVAGSLGYLMSISPNQKDAKQFINILKKAATYNLLYFAESNLVPGSQSDSAYLACYQDRSSCDYLLGTGFLNLYKAVNPAADEPFSEVDITKNAPVSSGCIVSSIGFNQFSIATFLSSMPFLLTSFLMLLFCRRNHRIKNTFKL